MNIILENTSHTPTVCTDIDNLTILNYTGVKEVQPINWSKFMTAKDLKNYNQPVVVKQQKETVVLFPPFNVELDIEKVSNFKKGINKKVNQTIYKAKISFGNMIKIS